MGFKNKYWLLILISMLGILWVMTQTQLFNEKVQKITISYKNIRCYVDGTLLVLRDKSNEVIEPFVYKKNIYIPVDSVANQMGYGSEWDQEKEALSFYKLENHIEKCEVTTMIPLIDASTIEKKVEVKWIKGRVYINHKPFDPQKASDVLQLKDDVYMTLDVASQVFNKDAIYSEDTLSIYFQDYKSINNERLDTQQPVTYEKLEALLNAWENDYDFIKIDSIGLSTEGREIYSIIINGEEDAQAKKEKVLLIGGIHSREDYSVTLLAKMLDEILFHYSRSGMWDEYDLKSLFSEVELHVVVLANPDGSNIVHHGIEGSEHYEYLKTLPDLGGDSRWWKANARGVDLNRNFPDSNWSQRETTQPASEGYKGDYPGSEKETQAIMKYCKDHHFIMAISYHTSGNSIFWADQGTHDVFRGVDEKLIDEFSELTGYRKLKVSKDPSLYASGFENWFREKYHRLSFVVELSPYPGLGYVQHPDKCFDSLVWPRAKHSGVFLMSKVKELKDSMYDIYIDNKWVKTFYNEADAQNYALENPDSKIIYRNREINK